MTQDKETLREAVARAIWPSDFNRLDAPTQRFHLRMADAAIATMFERLRTPSERMIEAGCNWCKAEWDDEDCRTCLPDIFDAMLAAFVEEAQK